MILDRDCAVIEAVYRHDSPAEDGSSSLVIRPQGPVSEGRRPGSSGESRGPGSLITFEVGGVEGEPGRWDGVPVLVHHETYGFVLARSRGTLSELEIVAMEHASTIAALEFLKQIAVNEVERRFKTNFIDDVIASSFSSKDSLIRRAKFFGWDFARPYLVMMVDLDNFEEYCVRYSWEDEKKVHEVKERFLRSVTEAASCAGESIISIDKSDSVVVLVPVQVTSQQLASDKAVDMGNRIRLHVKQCLKDLTVSVGIGRSYPDATDLHKSYNEARQALRQGRKAWGGDRVIHYDELGIYRLFNGITEGSEMRLFYEETLAPVAKYDQRHGTDLLQTLEVFFKCNCNLKECADQLYLHVNTVKYRLGRIERLLGIDLKDPEKRFNLQLGLKIHQLYLERR